ncbi:MAG: GntR family transcriptional regulator [Pyrinomonadaceae bacterium]|nr:GntR family transcriptional regulator [Pyrinomonadaceae bacterium]MCX7640819.1 GntR family transcriptional regulator [Pyrinomonadaceae bacterium]MDW8303416.1 GntR family transcriptional regulator [Acidobacteriota bacterium]
MPKLRQSFADSRIPLYYQLENVLREKIISGEFEPGQKIPTELELIDQYGVSRITVRQALQALAEEGLIERKQGRGTIVAIRKTKRRKFSGIIHLTGSLDELIEMGMETPVKVLEMNKIEADSHEAELLQIKPGEPIYRLKRLRMHEGKPFGLIVNYLPEEIGSNLTMAELSSGALLNIIEKKFGYRLESALQEIRAELADAYVAQLLDVRVGTALLSIDRTVYALGSKPVEYVHSLYRSDLYGYSVKLLREKKDE